MEDADPLKMEVNMLLSGSSCICSAMPLIKKKVIIQSASLVSFI